MQKGNLQISLKELSDQLEGEKAARRKIELERDEIRKERDEIRERHQELKKQIEQDNADKNYDDQGVFTRTTVGSVTKFDPIVSKLGLRMLLTSPIAAEAVPLILEVLQDELGLWPGARIPTSRYFQELRYGLPKILAEQQRAFISESLHFGLFLDGTQDKNNFKVSSR